MKRIKAIAAAAVLATLAGCVDMESQADRERVDAERYRSMSEAQLRAYFDCVAEETWITPREIRPVKTKCYYVAKGIVEN